MKQKHLARLAAFLVGATGAVAFGDHDGTGSLPDCSFAPAHCTAECASLYNCLASPTGGFVECASESSAYESCKRLPPPIGPGNPGGIIIPPPSCPPGQHYAGGQCQANYECGDDEIGGGPEECTACGEGQVPNEDGTECVECDYGESRFTPGVCDPAIIVARCTRPLASLPLRLAQYLPYHVNVFVKKHRNSPPPMERGFFAVNMVDAVVKALLLLDTGKVAFTPGKVEQDADLGNCVYEPDAGVIRLNRVATRMVNYRWKDYHLILKKHGHDGYGSCIAWADSVLDQGSHF